MSTENIQNRLRVLLNENQFIIPSYQLYGGVSGYQDYGVLGTVVKNRFLNEWRRFFLNGENIDEIETPTVVPHDLLKASGHVDRFTDFVLYDENGLCYRADHVVKKWMEENKPELADKVDGWDQTMLELQINSHKIVEGEYDEKTKKHKPVRVHKKNLMYEIPSPTGDVDYLRPELAQGIFVNFRLVQQFLKKELPFGIAQVGKSFRKEISPTPFTRMREFMQAEIEYFVDNKNKSHPNFDAIKDYEIPILSAKMQISGTSGTSGANKPIMVKIGEAVASKTICHQVMGYFLARIHQFAIRIGLNPGKIRFRQHQKNEMAHYASECWDLETKVLDGWLECVGCADRGDYDLQCHGSMKLASRRQLDEPIIEKKLVYKLDKGAIGKKYRDLTMGIVKYFEKLDDKELHKLRQTFENGKEMAYIYVDDSLCIITGEMVEFLDEELKTEYEEFVPHVVEPSFGIDRLLYSIFEHSFYPRLTDKKRGVLGLPHTLAPYDISVLQLHNKPELIAMANKIKEMLKQNSFAIYTDNSGVAIGRKYVRQDEIGVKFAITVDPGSLNDNMVTIRERDSMKQIRVPVEAILDVLKDIDSNFS